MDNRSFSRRAAFSAAAGVAVTATFIDEARAAKMNAGEKANVELVNRFLKLSAAPDVTGAKVVAYLAEDCELRFPSSPQWFLGKPAALAMFEYVFDNGVRSDLRVHESFAKGPVVLNYRSDTIIKAGNPGEPIDVMGFFILRDGKIQRWEDIVLDQDRYPEWRARNF